MNERSRRIWVASEAQTLGYGGQKIVHEAPGLSCATIIKGQRELAAGDAVAVEDGGIGKAGGGRKRQVELAKGLAAAITEILEGSTGGDPETPLRWTIKSTRTIAAALNQDGQRVSHSVVADILDDMGYSLQANRKVKEGRSHPDRDAQFQYIADKTKAFQQRQPPAISVATKKKELIGEYKNGGQVYRPKGDPTLVNGHDFIDKAKGKASPYGVYALAKNEGWVSVGISSDTAEFAVNSIRTGWFQMGTQRYPDASELYITADGGGSNGSRVRLWKVELQRFADETGLDIHVSHFPPGTSKWNKIEHKMFCFIASNWRGKPLIDTATIVQLIGNTTTTSALTIKACLDERIYQKSIKVTDETLDLLALEKDLFHGEWNYKITPREL